MNDIVTEKSTPNPTLNVCSRARGIRVRLGVLSVRDKIQATFGYPEKYRAPQADLPRPTMAAPCHFLVGGLGETSCRIHRGGEVG